MGLVQVVRPFQLPQNVPPTIVVTDSGATSGATADMVVTATPFGKTLQVSFSASYSCYMTKVQKEKSTKGGDTSGFGPSDFNAALSDGNQGFSNSDLAGALGFGP